MTSDPEAQFYKEFATIESLKADVKILKSSHKKLSKKFDNIEIQDFHDQIQALNKRIDELHDVILKAHIQALNSRIDEVRQSVLSTNIVLANLLIEYTQYHFLSVSAVRLKDNPSLFNQIEQNIIIESTIAHQRCLDSSSPLDIANEFRLLCISCSKEQKLRVYRSEL